MARSPVRAGHAGLGRPVILVSNSVFPDRVGGLERYVTELADRLALRGVAVHVVVRSSTAAQPARETRVSGATVHRMPLLERTGLSYLVRYPLQSIGSVRRTLHHLPHDGTLHSHFAVQGLPVALGGRSYIHTFHGTLHKEIREERNVDSDLPSIVWRAAEWAVRGLERFVLRRASTVLTLSDFMQGEVRSVVGSAVADGRVLPGGVDTEYFTPGPAGTLASESSGTVIACARRLVPRMGVLELVEAMPAVVARVPDAVLHIAGDGPLRDEIVALTERLNLRGHVVLRGTLGQIELRQLYREASIAVVPTQRREGFGLAAVEAMACETPTIVTPVGALPEIARRVSPQLVTRSADAVDLAEAVLQVLGRSSGDLRDLGLRSRELVEHRYSWDVVVDAHLAVYAEHELAAGGRTP